MSIVMLVGMLSLSACSGSGVDRPEHTGPANTEGSGMDLVSSAFESSGRIPSKYTCDGAGVSPPLSITALPEGTVSLALVVDDPDAPRGTWDHWVAYDVPVTETIPEGVPELGTAGTNSWGRPGYGGPCPPSGSHRYFFTVYALDASLDLPPGATKSEVLEAIAGHVVAEATLIGLYSR